MLECKIIDCRHSVEAAMQQQKRIYLTIKDVKYYGDNIGDDFELHIQINEHHIQQDIKAIYNKTVKNDLLFFNNVITAEQLNLQCKLIEKDPVFDDISNSVALTFPLLFDITASKSIKLFIREKKFNTQEKLAYLIVNFEIDIRQIIYFVDLMPTGWLKFIDKNSMELAKKKYVALAYGTKIELIDKNNHFFYFRVLEGVNINLILALEKEKYFYLSEKIQHKEAAYLIYSISKQILYINETPYMAVDYKNNQLKKGVYKIFIPDYPHGYGIAYKEQSKYTVTWFRLSDKDKYLHTGKLSAGCITIKEIKKWDEIYNKIILSREDAGIIGSVKVID